MRILPKEILQNSGKQKYDYDIYCDISYLEKWKTTSVLLLNVNYIASTDIEYKFKVMIVKN